MESESNASSSAEEGPKLSHRAEVFRSKLIEEFQILEGTSEQGKKKVPVYSTTEMIGKISIINSRLYLEGI